MFQKILKSKSIFLFICSLFLFTACNQSQTNVADSSEHNLIIKECQQAQKSLDQAKNEIEKATDIYQKLEKELSTQRSSDFGFAAMVKKQATNIAIWKGIVKKQDVLVTQHAQYEKAHEGTALSTVEIDAQHAQMKKDHQNMLPEQQLIITGVKAMEAAANQALSQK